MVDYACACTFLLYRPEKLNITDVMLAVICCICASQWAHRTCHMSLIIINTLKNLFPSNTLPAFTAACTSHRLCGDVFECVDVFVWVHRARVCAYVCVCASTNMHTQTHTHTCTHTSTTCQSKTAINNEVITKSYCSINKNRSGPPFLITLRLYTL